MYERFAYVYDRLMRDMPYEQWQTFLLECFARYGNPKTVVDLGCGTGKLSIPLAESGYRVTGIDMSADMLQVAADNASGAALHGGGQLRWLRQDMRELALPEQADAVFSFCDCLNYLLEEDDVRRAFRSVYTGLGEGGIFVFDVHAPSQIQAYAEEQPFVLNEADVAYLWTCDYDPRRNQVFHDLTFFVREDEGAERDGRFDEQHSQRGYPPDWLSDELRSAGFIVLDRCADFHWSPPDDESERIFFVALKPRQ